MSSTEAPAPAGAPVAVQRLLSRNGLIVAAALAAAVALAWTWLAAQPMAGSRGEMAEMPDMAAEAWSAAYLLPAFAMWALMMVAMMLPSAAPMILLHARIDRGTQRARLVHSSVFVLAYLGVWTVFGAAAAAAQAWLVDLGLVSAMTLTLGSRIAAAGLLVAAAAWQLTAAKRVCLDRCRSPLGFVLRYWRPGIAGALRLGLVHGLYCLGCCWALMLLLFAGGVMNLAWIAALAALVLAEKYAPPRWQLSRIVAAALLTGSTVLVVSGL